MSSRIIKTVLVISQDSKVKPAQYVNCRGLNVTLRVFEYSEKGGRISSESLIPLTITLSRYLLFQVEISGTAGYGREYVALDDIFFTDSCRTNGKFSPCYYRKLHLQLRGGGLEYMTGIAARFSESTHHSTDTCLSYLNNKILQGFETGMFTGMILIDLQKAFDTIDHKIFLDKIACLGFNDSAILWFKSYLQDRSFSVNIGKEYSDPGNLSCGVPQGSILGPLIFLLYVNDMARAVDCDLLLYVDDSCLIFRDTDVERIENNLNRNFNSLCNWFVENKLSIHFGEDKTKSILFARKKYKNLKKMNIRRGDIEIKQHSVVTYLGSVLDENLSGESMATKMLGKINGKLKFLYRKRNFLDSSLRRLLLNALIQPHFDYACSSWYPMLNKRLSKKIQVAQNKCIRFYLNLKNTAHVGATEFKSINWLPTKHRVEQNICVNIMKFFNGTAPAYADEIFHPADQSRITNKV